MLTTTLLPDKCTLVMEETLPRGAYIDPDQLRDLRYSRGLRAHVPATVDIEKPEFESESHRVFVFRPLRVQENLRVTSVQLPVHMRYHKPSDQGGASPSGPSATVRINNPRLLLSCGDSEDILANCSERRVISYCDETGAEKCDWLNLPYKINVASIEVDTILSHFAHFVKLNILNSHVNLYLGHYNRVKQKLMFNAEFYNFVTCFRSHSL